MIYQEYLISLALKLQLTNMGAVNKQQLCPALVSKAFEKLTKINWFNIDGDWEDLFEQSNLELWKLLTKKSAEESYTCDQIDSDYGIEGNNKLKERECNLLYLFQLWYIKMVGQMYLPVALLT